MSKITSLEVLGSCDYTTNDYELVVVQTPEHKAYGAYNRQYDVVEGIQTNLAQAMEMVDTFQKWLTDRANKEDRQINGQEALENLINVTEQS